MYVRLIKCRACNSFLYLSVPNRLQLEGNQCWLLYYIINSVLLLSHDTINYSYTESTIYRTFQTSHPTVYN